MIIGIGTDIAEVTRIAKSIEKKGFKEKVFSKMEIAYCEAKANKAESYTARFAAKEAFLKAAGTGWINELNLFEIEIVNDEKQPESRYPGEVCFVFEPMKMFGNCFGCYLVFLQVIKPAAVHRP